MAAALEKGRRPGFLVGLLFWMAGTGGLAVDYAGDVFSLEIWKLTLPMDDDGDGIADEVAMPVLRNFEDPGFFHLTETKDSILFRVPALAAKPGESALLRCGLRELVRKGRNPASWGSNDGLVHNLTISLAFGDVPPAGVQLIAAGIYADEEAVISVRLEKEGVVLTREGQDPLILRERYQPGDWIDLIIIIDQGRIRVFQSGKELDGWPFEGNGLHFRAGCEVKPDDPAHLESAFVGEVEIRKLFVTHQPR